MSTNNLQSTVKNVANKLAKALSDATALTVETRYFLTNASEKAEGDERGHLLARTVMQADGDTEMAIPMVRGEDGQLTANRELLELHTNNVKTALEYRANLLDSLLNAARSLS